MAQNTPTSSTTSSSALEREADHVDNLMNGDHRGSTPKDDQKGTSRPNILSQVEQDSRVEKMKTDTKAAGGGPDVPEDGLNQDG